MTMTENRRTKVPVGPDATGISDEEIEHFTIAEAALKLRMGKRKLAGLVAANQVPHTRNGRLVRFRRDHLLAISRAGDINPATRGRRRAA
jgi:excisionase family DNA binding protein